MKDSTQATCDYCGARLNCENGSVQDREYWRMNAGQRACEACLLQACDDFPEREETERLFALRLYHVRGINIEAIEATVCDAQAHVVLEHANTPLQELAEGLMLFIGGERLAAMAAGQAAWNTANSLHNVLTLKPEVQRDRARQAGTRKERRPEISGWIDDQLRRDPDAKVPALWAAAPDWITDQIGQSRFAKRVTERRKNAASN